jgi:hypothetical protein
MIMTLVGTTGRRRYRRLAAICLTLAIGCGRSDACTSLGCISYLDIDLSQATLPGASKLTACVASTCETYPLPAGAVRLVLSGVGPSIVVEVRIESASGSVLMQEESALEMARYEPNGGGCAPACWQGSVSVGPLGAITTSS